MLKQLHPNPSRRSSHHVRQSRFEGSYPPAEQPPVRAVIANPFRGRTGWRSGCDRTGTWREIWLTLEREGVRLGKRPVHNFRQNNKRGSVFCATPLYRDLSFRYFLWHAPQEVGPFFISVWQPLAGFVCPILVKLGNLAGAFAWHLVQSFSISWCFLCGKDTLPCWKRDPFPHRRQWWFRQRLSRQTGRLRSFSFFLLLMDGCFCHEWQSGNHSICTGIIHVRVPTGQSL